MLAGFFDGQLHGVGISVGQHIHEERVFPIFRPLGRLSMCDRLRPLD